MTRVWLTPRRPKPRPLRSGMALGAGRGVEVSLFLGGEPAHQLTATLDRGRSPWLGGRVAVEGEAREVDIATRRTSRRPAT